MFLPFTSKKFSELNLINHVRKKHKCVRRSWTNELRSAPWIFFSISLSPSSPVLCNLLLSLAPACDHGSLSLPEWPFTGKCRSTKILLSFLTWNMLECVFHIPELIWKIKLRLGLAVLTPMLRNQVLPFPYSTSTPWPTSLQTCP